MPTTDLKEAIRGYLQKHFPQGWQYGCLVIQIEEGLPPETLMILNGEKEAKTSLISQRLFCSFPTESIPTPKPQMAPKEER